MLRQVTLALAVTLAALATQACGGAAFDGRTYRGHGLEFRVGPEGDGWKRLDTSEGLLAFRDEQRKATILVNGRCGKDGDDVPLSSLTGHLFLRFTERETQEEEVIPFDGREAQRTVIRAKLDGVPFGFETYVLKKNGCVYDFVLIAEPQTFADARPPFDRFVRGFHAEAP